MDLIFFRRPVTLHPFECRFDMGGHHFSVASSPAFSSIPLGLEFGCRFMIFLVSAVAVAVNRDLQAARGFVPLR